MNWNLVFWFYAYGLMLLAMVISGIGIAEVRKGNIQRHRGLLSFACNLIVFFVISYVFKMLFLGREDKSNWEPFYMVVLYIHEALIATMLITGIRGRWLAYKFGASLFAQQLPDEHVKQRKQHALMGKICLCSAALALITASGVLYGMVQRS